MSGQPPYPQGQQPVYNQGQYPPQQGQFPPQNPMYPPPQQLQYTQPGQTGAQFGQYPPQQGVYPNQQYPPYQQQGQYPVQGGVQSGGFPAQPVQHQQPQPFGGGNYNYPPQSPTQQGGFVPPVQNFPNQPQQQGYPPQMARFIVEAWDMFFNFPVEVSVSTMAYIDTVVREACQKANVPYNNVMGLKIKPSKTKKQISKAEFIPPNILVSQALQVHEQNPDQPLHVHLDLMPLQGLQLAKKDNSIFLDYTTFEEIRSHLRVIARGVVGLMNTAGGVLIIGVGPDFKLKGTQVNGMNSQALHKFFLQEFKSMIKPLTFEQHFKVKTHPITTSQSQQTQLSGVLFEVSRYSMPLELYSCDNIFFENRGNGNVEVPPHDLIKVVRSRKGKNPNDPSKWIQKNL